MNQMMVALLLLGTTFAHAWDVEKLVGNAYVLENNKKIEVTIGQQLAGGQLFVTESGARAQLKQGQSTMNLGGNTHIRLPGTDSREGSATLDLLYGKLRAKIAKPDAAKFKLQTPSAVVGVRGTEFFAASNESGDTLCTLEGMVHAQAGEDAVDIPEGKGLRLAPGSRPELRPNSPELVQRWLSETSVDGKDSDAVLFKMYDDQRPQYPVATKVWAGGFGWAYYCHRFNLDFNNSVSDQDANCLRLYLSPFIQIGEEYHLFIRPAVIGSYSNVNSVTDTVPAFSGNTRTTATLAEGYGQAKIGNGQFKLGYQDIEWNDGVILSKQEWSQEPVTHLAARVQWALDDWGLEAVASERPSDFQPLDGHTNISLLGGRVLFPKDLGNVFFLQTDFGPFDPKFSPLVMGNKIQNTGYYGDGNHGRWDHRISLIYQNQLSHAVGTGTTAGSAPAVDGGLIDLEGGVYAFQSPVLRLSVRFMHASPNFISILEDNYAMGYSGLIRRANLQQWRGKAELQLRDTHMLAAELINNQEVSAVGYVRQSTSMNSGEPAGNEFDLLYLWKPCPKFDFYLGQWTFVPPAASQGKDPAFGFFTRLVTRF